MKDTKGFVGLIKELIQKRIDYLVKEYYVSTDSQIKFLFISEAIAAVCFIVSLILVLYCMIYRHYDCLLLVSVVILVICFCIFVAREQVKRKIIDEHTSYSGADIEKELKPCDEDETEFCISCCLSDANKKAFIEKTLKQGKFFTYKANKYIIKQIIEKRSSINLDGVTIPTDKVIYILKVEPYIPSLSSVEVTNKYYFDLNNSSSEVIQLVVEELSSSIRSHEESIQEIITLLKDVQKYGSEAAVQLDKISRQLADHSKMKLLGEILGGFVVELLKKTIDSF